MALIPIMGQPVNLVPNNERAFGCEIPNNFCVLYGQDAGEKIMFQMKQTPCDGTIISNGNFADGTDWTADANVVIAQNKATHVVGASGELYQSLAPITGSYFKVDFMVTGMSAGTLDLYFTQAGMQSKRITENGIYTFYLFDLGDNDNILFLWSADCDASVSNVAVYQLLAESDLQAYLNTVDGAFVRMMTPNLFDEFIVFNTDATTLDEGCYVVEVIDPCVITGEMTDVFASPDFANPSDWNVTFNIPDAFIYEDFSGPGINVFWFDVQTTAPPIPNIAYATQPFSIPTTERLYVEFEVNMQGLVGVGTTNNVNVVLFAEDGGDIQEIIRKNTVVVPGCGPNCIFTAILPPDFLNSSNTNIGIFIEDTLGGNVNYIPYAQMRYAVITDEATGFFTSNCLKVSTDKGNTKLVEGFADNVNAFPLGNKSLGFMFVDNLFWLRARLLLSFANPHTPTDTTNILYSSGRKKKANAQLTKAWDLTFVEADENMHDTIANIINCDRFLIEGNDYISEEKEYTADYGEKGTSSVGESTVEVSKVEGTRFNVNA